ncbi:hypothetical protein ACNQFZ_18495 [Schinkia sp. CFF1]
MMIVIMSRKKVIQEETVSVAENANKTTIEDFSAPIIGVGEIPEGDLNELTSQLIKGLQDLEGEQILENQMYQISMDGSGNVVSRVEVGKETVSKETEAVLVYCGPTINQITRYTSFKNGYPVHLKEHLEKFPVLENLFVEPNNFAEFERKVAIAGTVENIWFEKVKEYFSKAVK